MKYILKHKGCDRYFESMARIGPLCTTEIDHTPRFDTKLEAESHPAFTHYSNMFEAVEKESE